MKKKIHEYFNHKESEVTIIELANIFPFETIYIYIHKDLETKS